jgi:hypothetical protein
MSLILVYVVCIFLGNAVNIGISEIVEFYSEQASLAVFLTLYFGIFWGAWVIAVRVTEPKAKPVAVQGETP